MPRRKTPTTAAAATTAGVYLEDDEQLVEEVTTTKKIGRQRRTPASEDVITVEPEAIEIETDEEDEIEQPRFGQSSIAAVLFGEGDELDNEPQFCTIAVRRNPDSMNDRFASPCSSLTNLPALRNVEITADKMDIEERVRSQFGGGHYFFQIHFRSRLAASWTATLSDLPAGFRPQSAETPTEHVAPAPAAPAANPMDTFLADLERTKRLKEALFGDDQKRYEDSIAALRTELEAAKSATSNEPPMSEELLMWKMAKDMPESEAKNRLLDKLMPTDTDGNRHWIADVLQIGFENKDTIVGVLGSLLGGIMPPQPAAAQPNIADMMRQQPPTGLPERRPSVFSRPAKAEPPPAPIAEPVNETPDVTANDAAAIDAEVIDQEPKTNAKRKRTAA